MANLVRLFALGAMLAANTQVFSQASLEITLKNGSMRHHHCQGAELQLHFRPTAAQSDWHGEWHGVGGASQ